jgi:hypothetical protein
MQNKEANALSQGQPITPEAKLLAGLVRSGLSRRLTVPAETEVVRLVRALTRLQPAALAALSSSPPASGQHGQNEKSGSTAADPEDAFLAALQSLVA